MWANFPVWNNAEDATLRRRAAPGDLPGGGRIVSAKPWGLSLKAAAEETLESLGLGQGRPSKYLPKTSFLFLSHAPRLFLQSNAGQLLDLQRELICLELSK